jgi:hypothetical protein
LLFWLVLGVSCGFELYFASYGIRAGRMRPEDIFGVLGVYFGATLVLGAACGMLIAGARRMMRLERYEWVMLSCFLAMLPWSGACIVGVPVSLWALLVLRRREIRGAFVQHALQERQRQHQEPAELTSARRQVQSAATALMVAALAALVVALYVASSCLLLIETNAARWGNSEVMFRLWTSLASLPLLGLVLLAAWQMRALQGYGLAVAGSILALLPCSLLWPISFAVGSWSLLVLRRPEVIAAFGHSPTSPVGRSPGRRIVELVGWTTAFGIGLLIAGLLFEEYGWPKKVHTHQTITRSGQLTPGYPGIEIEATGTMWAFGSNAGRRPAGCETLVVISKPWFKPQQYLRIQVKTQDYIEEQSDGQHVVVHRNLPPLNEAVLRAWLNRAGEYKDNNEVTALAASLWLVITELQLQDRESRTLLDAVARAERIAPSKGVTFVFSMDEVKGYGTSMHTPTSVYVMVIVVLVCLALVWLAGCVFLVRRGTRPAAAEPDRTAPAATPSRPTGPVRGKLRSILGAFYSLMVASRVEAPPMPEAPNPSSEPQSREPS